MAVSPAAVVNTVPIYVGDLHPEMTDSEIEDAFSEFKSISSVRICRDSSSGRSLCYGYVNFNSLEDAIRAIEGKNNTTLNGKVIRVMWSHRDPSTRKSGKGNVFVKNLPESIDNLGLQNMFQKFGKILSCKVAMNEDGKSKGYGFVQFNSEESAIAAIEKLHDSNVVDKKLYVGRFVKKNDRVLSRPCAKFTNLYMKNLDPNVAEDLLREKFTEYGKIASLVVAKDENGNSRGFGFVNFENPDDARQAMQAMNGSGLGSKVLYVGRAQKKAEREHILRHQFEEKRKEQILKYKGSNVYVKNIDDNVTDEELHEIFSQCGTITSAKVMQDDKGKSKGFGFVCFSTLEEASKALNTFHGYMFHGKPLYVAIAQRKEDRQAQFRHQNAQRLAGLVGSSTTCTPTGYPPLYYSDPSFVISQVPPQPELMYQPMGFKSGWRGNGFAPKMQPYFPQSQFHLISNAPRQNRQNRGKMNGSHSISYMQGLIINSTDSSSQQGGGYVANGGSREFNTGYVASAACISNGTGSQGSETLSSKMLAAASPEQLKQFLGQDLYNRVKTYKPDLATKITGMLLEMENWELIRLLESPKSLAAKVDEAVQVLKLSKMTRVSGKCFDTQQE